MRVPFLDLADVVTELRPELDAAWHRVMDSGWFIGGAEVDAFEAEFAAFAGAKHGIGVANGLDALTLVLRAWGIGPGDEVIVPGHTFIATLLAVSQIGAVPVPVEVDDATCNLDPGAIEAAITAKTRAIIPVHLYGQLADMVAIAQIARKHGLLVLEDAAQAHGATRDGAQPATHGDAAAWSFYPGKNLGAFGDGGGITTNDDALAARLRTLRNYGSAVKYVHDERGVNSRLDTLQAALLRVRLAHLAAWNARRLVHAEAYLTALAPVAAAFPALRLPTVASDSAPVWHLFVVRHPQPLALAAALATRGVATQRHYPTVPHQTGAYAEQLGHVDLPVSERIASEALSLPMGPHLTTPQRDAVIVAVSEAVAELAARPTF